MSRPRPRAFLLAVLLFGGTAILGTTGCEGDDAPATNADAPADTAPGFTGDEEI